MHFIKVPERRATLVHLIALVVLFILLLLLMTPSASRGNTLIINEFMASNRFVLADEDGDYPDWLELHNAGETAIDLKDYWLSDDETQPFMWSFPSLTIEPGSYLVVFASGKDRTDPAGAHLHTNFRIRRTGDAIFLGEPGGSVLDEIGFEKSIPSNVSYGRISPQEDEWAYFLEATPGRANDETPYGEVLDRPMLQEAFPVYINEYITSNLTSIEDEDGDLHDWIELYNSGEEPVSLKGYWLSDKESNPYKWRFPDVMIEPDDYLLIFASGKHRRDPAGDYLHTNYALNDVDDELVFSTPEGKRIEILPIRNMYRDISYGRDLDDPDAWLYYPQPTPGQANHTQGFTSLTDGTAPETGLVHINEVMAENLTTQTDEDGEYSDWIELYNSSDRVIHLKDFGLSDAEDDPFRWRFPDVHIGAGEHLLIFASRKDRRDAGGAYLHTNYQIQATGETVVLTHPSGFTLDRLHTGRLAPDMSVGRYPDGDAQSRYFFTEATPGGANAQDYYLSYTPAPRVSLSGGFYEEPVTVTIEPPSPQAEIRYTLSGKEPSGRFTGYTEPLQLSETTQLRPQRYEEGQEYTGKPIEITETTVLRVKAYEEGKLPSTAVNHSYFIGTEHTLPVVSIMVDPDEMFHPVHGIYERGVDATQPFPYTDANFWQPIELPIHLELYEESGKKGFAFDMGLRIAGQFSRTMDQKSFNVFARNIYGYNEFKYPFFPDFYPEKPLANKAITLRTSGQDADYSKIRDIMMTSLLKDTGLDYQAHRQAVLYINGAYWGIYNIRERINEHFLAYNHGVDADKIDLLQGDGWVRAGSSAHYFDMLRFARRHDMSQPENYAYVQSQMDVINFIDFWVSNIYFTQTDPNIRFWREQRPEGKWRWIVFDLDWGFWDEHITYNTLGAVTAAEGTSWARIGTHLLRNLMDNTQFRETFVERTAHYLNDVFNTQRVLERIDRLAANIETEVERDFARWGRPLHVWHQHIDILRRFAQERQGHLLPHIQRYFSLSDEDMQIFDVWE